MRIEIFLKNKSDDLCSFINLLHIKIYLNKFPRAKKFKLKLAMLEILFYSKQFHLKIR